MAFAQCPSNSAWGIDPGPVRPTRRPEAGCRCRSSLVLIVTSPTYKRSWGCMYVRCSSPSRSCDRRMRCVVWCVALCCLSSFHGGVCASARLSARHTKGVLRTSASIADSHAGGGTSVACSPFFLFRPSWGGRSVLCPPGPSVSISRRPDWCPRPRAACRRRDCPGWFAHNGAASWLFAPVPTQWTRCIHPTSTGLAPLVAG